MSAPPARPSREGSVGSQPALRDSLPENFIKIAETYARPGRDPAAADWNPPRSGSASTSQISGTTCIPEVPVQNRHETESLRSRTGFGDLGTRQDKATYNASGVDPFGYNGIPQAQYPGPHAVPNRGQPYDPPDRPRGPSFAHQTPASGGEERVCYSNTDPFAGSDAWRSEVPPGASWFYSSPPPPPNLHGVRMTATNNQAAFNPGDHRLPGHASYYNHNLAYPFEYDDHKARRAQHSPPPVTGYGWRRNFFFVLSFVLLCILGWALYSPLPGEDAARWAIDQDNSLYIMRDPHDFMFTGITAKHAASSITGVCSLLGISPGSKLRILLEQVQKDIEEADLSTVRCLAMDQQSVELANQMVRRQNTTVKNLFMKIFDESPDQALATHWRRRNEQTKNAKPERPGLIEKIRLHWSGNLRGECLPGGDGAEVLDWIWRNATEFKDIAAESRECIAAERRKWRAVSDNLLRAKGRVESLIIQEMGTGTGGPVRWWSRSKTGNTGRGVPVNQKVAMVRLDEIHTLSLGSVRFLKEKTTDAKTNLRIVNKLVNNMRFGSTTAAWGDIATLDRTLLNVTFLELTWELAERCEWKPVHSPLWVCYDVRFLSLLALLLVLLVCWTQPATLSKAKSRLGMGSLLSHLVER
ncbi:hypothetical protein NLU13_8695 [Sarocladium strictum]|uniref:Uncharacterized protein n=1 Tax=Sarocladium strictum TaxID=5046 RepID=A0AA39GDN3_SARSR|nr:hypothetical protein NLU13_8695 [Sarocladium strictum]